MRERELVGGKWGGVVKTERDGPESAKMGRRRGGGGGVGGERGVVGGPFTLIEKELGERGGGDIGGGDWDL